MRNLLALLFALLFVLHGAVQAATPAHACCQQADCPMVQCLSAGCLPSTPPAANLALPAAIAAAPCHIPFPDAEAILPRPLKEVWCPPD